MYFISLSLQQQKAIFTTLFYRKKGFTILVLKLFLFTKKNKTCKTLDKSCKTQLKIKLYNILHHIFLKMYIYKLKILFYNVLDAGIGREEAQLVMRKAGELLQSFYFA